MATPIFLFGQFMASKVGKTGLTVTVDVDAYELATGTRTSPVTAGGATEARNGIYFYRLAAADPSLYDYTATFKTDDATVDAKHVPSWRGSFEQIMAAVIATYLDAAISSRAAPGAAMTLASGAITAAVVATGAIDADALADDAGTELAAAVVAASVAGAASGTVGGALGLLTSAQATIVANYDPATQALHYLYGDDYAAADNRAQDFITTHILTAGAVNWRVQAATGVIVVACTLVDAFTYRLAPTAAQLATIGVGVWRYDLEMMLASGRTITEISGSVTISADVR